MKKILIIIIGVTVVATSTHFCVRTLSRVNLLGQLLSKPHENERTRVQLDLIVMNETPNDGTLYNLGYASFSSPYDIQLYASENGTHIYCSSETFEILISPPVDQRISQTDILLPDQSLVDRSIEREETMPFSKLDIVKMDEYDFSNKTSKLLDKSKQWAGHAGTCTYSTPWTKGLILVGRDRTDNSIAQVDIDNLTDKLTIRLSIISKNNAVVDLEPILSSFRFSVGSVGSATSISNLIAKVGIQQKENE